MSFQEPVSPWRKTQKAGWEAVWQHPKSQSLISYFSSCSSSIPFTSLSDFQQDFLSGLQSFSFLKESKILYQGQKAHRINLRSSKFQGKRKQMIILLFKKEDCFYVLSFLVHSSGALSKDIKIFDQFIEGFKVL